ncbi:hypothetical protein ABEQ41_31180 [Priestia megaterium]
MKSIVILSVKNLEAFNRTLRIGRKLSEYHFYHPKKNIELFQLFVKEDEEKEQFARSISVEDLIMVVKEKHEQEAKELEKTHQKILFLVG